MTIVKATLRDTDIEITFELTEKQYAHYRFLMGQPVGEVMPLDQNVTAEMAALLEHLVGGRGEALSRQGLAERKVSR